MWNKELEKILVCPISKKPMIYDEKGQRLISFSARVAYPVRSGIPVLLVDEAEKLSDAEMKAITDSVKEI